MIVQQGFLRYVQQKHAVVQLQDDLKGLDTLFILGGRRALAVFNAEFHADQAIRIHTAMVEEKATVWSRCTALAHQVLQADAQAVIGVGGGVALDMAKAVAVQSGRPLYLVPTQAATCSAATTLIALYDEEGRRTGSYTLPRPIDGVYVDETLLASAPQRTLRAGIADGMAKLSEAASACLYADNPPEPRWRSMMAQALHLMDIYFTHAAAALDGEEASLSEIYYANLYLTAQITATGTERRIGEIAHAFYNGCTALFPVQRLSHLHGEIVGVGILLELELTGAVAGYTRRSLQAFLKDILLCPTTLKELKLPTDEISTARLCAYISEKAKLSPMSVVLALGTLRE